MAKNKYIVGYFQSNRGTSPVLDYLNQLPTRSRSKVSHLITILQEYGPSIKPPYSKKIQEKLWELRSSGNESIRIFYTKFNNKYYLLHIFRKKTNKTPIREINTALDRMKELYNI